MPSSYFVYILTNQKNGTLYIGVTNNLKRRIYEHKRQIHKGFSARYDLSRLVYFEMHHHINDAILREKRIKKWKRVWKVHLIISMNPDWIDLAKDWYD
ncbi:MAG: GIY-YIG nuclease family protein [Bacteroidota bacterium]